MKLPRSKFLAKLPLCVSFLLLLFAYFAQSKNVSENEPMLLISTVDGGLVAVSKYTGSILWQIKSDPLVRLSLPLDSRYFIQYDDDNKALRHYSVMPDPDDGSMYLYSYTLPTESETDDAAGRTYSKSNRRTASGERSRSVIIRKLPFTIPELVQRSPYPSHDGIMYTGSKSDTWLEIHRASGRINRALQANGAVHEGAMMKSLNSTSPNNDSAGNGTGQFDGTESTDAGGFIYLGRTEYRVSVFDRHAYWDQSTLIWNLTYTSYAARPAASASIKREPPTQAHDPYDLVHLCSNANGWLQTFRRSTGEFLWHINIGRSPIVSVYELVSPSPLPKSAPDAEPDADAETDGRRRARRNTGRDTLSKVTFTRFSEETLRRGYEYLSDNARKRTLQDWFRSVLSDTLDSLSISETEALERMRIAALLATLYVRVVNESTLVALPTVVDAHTFLLVDRLRADERCEREAAPDPLRFVGYHVPDEPEDQQSDEPVANWRRLTARFERLLLESESESESENTSPYNGDLHSESIVTCRALVPRGLQILTDSFLLAHQLHNFAHMQHSKGGMRESFTWTNDARELQVSEKENDAAGERSARKRQICSRYELLFAETRGISDRHDQGYSRSLERESASASATSMRDRYNAMVMAVENGIGTGVAADGSNGLQLRLQPGETELYAYFYEQFFEMQSMRDGLNALDAKIQVGFVAALVTVVFFFCYYHPKHVQRSLEVNLQRMLDQQFSQLRAQSTLCFTEQSANSASTVAAAAEAKLPDPEVKAEVASDAAVTTISELQRADQSQTFKRALGKIEVRVSFECLLGYGSNGAAVYRGSFESRPAAIKCTLKKRDADDIAIEDCRELDMLRCVQHPNLVRYLCMEEDCQYRYLALELCECTLDCYLADSGGALVQEQAVKTEAEADAETPTQMHQTQTEAQSHAEVPSQSDGKSMQLTPVEICDQILRGLVYLHSLNIVHRDLKPGNVLISFADASGARRVVLTDFGFSKRLSGPKASVEERSDLQSALNRVGTRGWVAPELCAADASVTCAVDLFAAGCLFFYVLTRGVHPFDLNTDNLPCINTTPLSSNLAMLRQENIAANRYSLDRLSRDEHCEARDLITKMIAFYPVMRPPARRVGNHPFFWPPLKRLQFLLELSDRVEKTTNERDEMIVRMLDLNATTVLGGSDWRTRIGSELQADLRKFRTYRGDSVRDLLRAIRNKKHHYRELSDELRLHLGTLPDGFLAYFTCRFPRLLTHSYCVAEAYCAEESSFRQYFDAVD